jgi:predicted XRE-type DNA-binding protein
MSENEKKGITVKIDADLHTQVRQYIEANGMTMAEFVSKALDDELHPKMNIKEEKYMGNMRTMAFQVPEDLFQQIKDYLERHNMTQKQFVLGLIQDELDRDYEEQQAMAEKQEQSDDEPAEDEEEALDNDEELSEDGDEELDEDEDEELSEDDDESEDEEDDEDLDESEDMDESDDEEMSMDM